MHDMGLHKAGDVDVMHDAKVKPDVILPAPVGESARRTPKLAAHWRILVLLVALLAGLSTLRFGWKPTRRATDAESEVQEHLLVPNSAGRTDAVQWDGYSLILRGQRVFIQYAYPFVATFQSLIETS